MSDEQLRAAASRLWVERGVAMVRPSWLPAEHDRLRLIELVDKVHGERG